MILDVGSVLVLFDMSVDKVGRQMVLEIFVILYGSLKLKLGR